MIVQTGLRWPSSSLSKIERAITLALSERILFCSRECQPIHTPPLLLPSRQHLPPEIFEVRFSANWCPVYILRYMTRKLTRRRYYQLWVKHMATVCQNVPPFRRLSESRVHLIRGASWRNQFEFFPQNVSRARIKQKQNLYWH